LLKGPWFITIGMPAMIWKKRKTPLKVTQEQLLRRLAEMELAAREFYEGLREGTESSRLRELADIMIAAEKRHHDRFSMYADRAGATLDPDS
jgi:rubrerythrin